MGLLKKGGGYKCECESFVTDPNLGAYKSISTQ
jgi:hypothetical protein